MVWDPPSGRELRTLVGHSREVNGVTWSRDGRLAFSPSFDQTLTVWNLETGEVFVTFTCVAGVLCCAFSVALKLIVVGDAGGNLYFLRLEEPRAKV